MAQSTHLFAKALAELDAREADGMPWTLPQPWATYCDAAGFGGKRAKTAAHISLQHRGDLKAELADASAMLLRVGRGTFSLVRARAGVDDFFLPSRHPEPREVETFLPDLSFSEWYQFHLLGSLIEANAVQFAVATGLFGHALGLDKPWPRVAPATSHSAYTFDFRPRRDLEACVLRYEGQVEIDAAFLAKRDGKWCFFVVEAKHGAKPYALAKHKLALAVHALAARGSGQSAESGRGIPADIPFVPVFVRSWSAGGMAHYEVLECEAMRSDELPGVDGICGVAGGPHFFAVPLSFG